MQPIIVLDVDGALSPVSPMNEPPDEADLIWGSVSQYAQARSPGSFGLYAARAVLDWLVTIHDKDDADIRWLTSWGTSAQTIVAPDFGLPHWDVIVANRYSTQQWWKFTAMQQLLYENPGRTVVWIDDDIATHHKAGYITQLIDQHPLTCIVPNRYRGISRDDLRVIEEVL